MPGTLQRLRRLKPLRIVDSKRVLGITILIGTIRLPSRHLYWFFSHDSILGTGKAALSLDHYTRYLHVSVPTTTPVPRKDWWHKLGPLSSHLRKRSQVLYCPSTHIAADESTAECCARNKHIVRTPSRPIPCGYKVLALGDAGYKLNWLFASRVDGIAELKLHPDLSPTGSAVLQLSNILDSNLRYIVYIDDAFMTAPFFTPFASAASVVRYSAYEFS